MDSTPKVDEEVKNYVEKYSSIQKTILDYIDEENETFEDFTKKFGDLNIHDKQVDNKKMFDILRSIINNHHRDNDFFTKIEQILIFLKPKIEKHFINFEIFNI